MIKGKPRRLTLVFPFSPIYFLTCCTLHRKNLLANDAVHERFRRYCKDAGKFDISVGRYVLMPDHFHLFVCGGPEFVLGVWVRGLKRAMVPTGGMWQPGFFDHVLRSDESYSQKWNYVRENPLRAGLARTADDWPFQGEICRIEAHGHV
jgi:REP element-mobilizing transposase RayT